MKEEVDAVRALLVYESMFGNTKLLAEAVAEGLASRMTVELVEVGEAPGVVDAEVALVVVGAPTHAFSLSRPSTREEAKKQSPQGVVSSGIGLREWLEGVRVDREVPAAAFDTRAEMRIPGSAAKAATRRLRHAGFRIVGRPASFSVRKTSGPLAAGEIGRARVWGRELAAQTLAVAP